MVVSMTLLDRLLCPILNNCFYGLNIRLVIWIRRKIAFIFLVISLVFTCGALCRLVRPLNLCCKLRFVSWRLVIIVLRLVRTTCPILRAGVPVYLFRMGSIGTMNLSCLLRLCFGSRVITRRFVVLWMVMVSCLLFVLLILRFLAWVVILMTPRI